MELHLKYDISLVCQVLLREHLEKHSIPYNLTKLGGVEIKDTVSADKARLLEAELRNYGIELIDNSKSIVVQKIKEAVHEIIYRGEKSSRIKLSDFLSGKLKLSYSYLSKIFSEETGMSVENYMIRHRIERVKQLITENCMTITEIAWKLNYSSAAHLSNQFKKITGLTPTFYQDLVIRKGRLRGDHNKNQPARNQPQLLKESMLL